MPGVANAQVDALLPLLGVGLRQQAVDWYVDEAWVAIITITVGEGGLQRLEDQMVYFRTEAVLASQVILLEDIQCLRDDRPLTPGATGVDLVAAVGGLDWLLDRDVELGQVLHGQPAALLARKTDHALGDVAGIEAVAGCPDTSLTGRRPALSLHQQAQRVGEVLLHHSRTKWDRMAIR